MRQETENPRNPSSQILPLVVAAFAGATLAIACERPDSRAGLQTARTPASVPAQQGPTTIRPQAPAAATPATPSLTADTLSDTVITGRIKAAILTDPAMAGADVSVNTDRGVVNLTGSVKSHEQTGVASGHAQRQDGVMRVDTHLAIAPQ